MCVLGCSRVLSPGRGLYSSQCVPSATAQVRFVNGNACTLRLKGCGGKGQASHFHWALGFAFRMCYLHLISACAWRLGTVRSI